MIANHIGCDNLHKSGERIGVALVKVPKKPKIVRTKLQVRFLNQVICSLRRTVTEPARGAQHYDGNETVEPANEFSPSVDLARSGASPQEFLN